MNNDPPVYQASLAQARALGSQPAYLMTQRERFAMAAFVGLLANSQDQNYTEESMRKLAEEAVYVADRADVLLNKALNKPATEAART